MNKICNVGVQVNRIKRGQRVKGVHWKNKQNSARTFTLPKPFSVIGYMPQSPEFSRQLTNGTAGASNKPGQCARRELSETKRQKNGTDDKVKKSSIRVKRARMDRTQNERKQEKKHRENAFYKRCHILSVLFKKVSRYRSAHARQKCAEQQASLKNTSLCSRKTKKLFCQIGNYSCIM